MWGNSSRESLSCESSYKQTHACFSRYILWVCKLHKLLGGECDNWSFLLMLNFWQKKGFQIFPIIHAPQKEKLLCCFGNVASLLIFYFFFQWGTLVMRTQEDTLFPSFSVNNRLSLFIPLPSSVPPSPAFSFSPLSLWLCASQHQRESSDLWPQQPTLNLAKEGEHPVCSLAGPK